MKAVNKDGVLQCLRCLIENLFEENREVIDCGL